MAEETLAQELERRVEAMGFEFVELERGGTKQRPVLRLRADRPDAEPGRGITLDECAEISRALEAYLDEHPTLPATYVLEVSSPGIERPLVRSRDFERFRGREIALKGYGPLADRGRRLTGELLGLVDEDGQERIRLRLEDGEEVGVPRESVARAHLVFRWDDAD